VGGRQEVGHIDLLDTISYFEVPEKDARKVMTQLTGIRYKGRTVRCNSEDERDATPASNKGNKGGKGRKKDDWRSLMNPSRVDFKGEVPDFSEEGWARRKPKKR
jgi:ATP-dependent RNA helicase DeaD